MTVVGMCTNLDCTHFFVNRPVPPVCPSCKSEVIQTCKNPVCNSPIESMRIDPKRLPEFCVDCYERLRFRV